MSAVMREAEMSDWEPPGLAASASINFDKQQFEGEWRVFPPLDVDPILASAITCFLEVGYHGSTIRTIASGANISVPGLYHHYHNKQELLVAILDLTMQELYARLSSARSEGSTHVDRYCLMVEALALFHIHRRPLGLIGSSEMRYIEGSERTRVASLRTGLQRMMDNEVTGAVHDGEFATMHPADAARAISNMCVALSQWYSEAGPLTPNEIARQYARFAYDTMRANGWAESTGAEFV
jgi:AcrR family transcriptional regulator